MNDFLMPYSACAEGICDEATEMLSHHHQTVFLQVARMVKVAELAHAEARGLRRATLSKHNGMLHASTSRAVEDRSADRQGHRYQLFFLEREKAVNGKIGSPAGPRFRRTPT